MPCCVICDSRFCYASWSGPAEPCDCGRCLRREDVTEETPLSDLRQRYRDNPESFDQPEEV